MANAAGERNNNNMAVLFHLRRVSGVSDKKPSRSFRFLSARLCEVLIGL